ncbi:glycosyltransferase [Winogradskyella sp.]|uniref:glycosyltransferase n=1 Tax=Winogradskyella sp. TaxID=1883156 RepID=UPI0025DCF985|nr:glycosyltransferase [Winogradskyella sp.]
MRLSIIIPVYNAAKFISICLDSLLAQDIDSTDYEILVINDGSTDNSLAIANTYSNKHKHIKVHTKENGGVGSARNKGLSLSKGTYVYFIDPDDYLAQDVLKTILEQAENRNLDILTFISQSTTDSNLYHSTPDITGQELSTILTGEDYIAKHNYNNEVWWYVIKREFIEEIKIKFIEDRWMEDAILTAKLFLKAKKMAFFPINAHRHLIVEGSAMTNKEPSHYLRVIDDNRNAAIVFESLIKGLEQSNVNSECIKRLRTRQQSFVFFLMVRMLKSTISLNQAKKAIDDISNTNAYPMNTFPGSDYKGITYSILTKLFNSKQIFYLLFRLFNPFLK